MRKGGPGIRARRRTLRTPAVSFPRSPSDDVGCDVAWRMLGAGVAKEAGDSAEMLRPAGEKIDSSHGRAGLVSHLVVTDNTR